MTLIDLIKRSAQQHADRPALTMKVGYRTVTLTYAQLYEQARAVAGFLAKHGVGQGDRVLLLAPNSPYWVVVFWGCVLRGAQVVPLNPQTTASLLERIAHQTEAKVVFKYVHYQESLPSGLAHFDVDFLPELIAGLGSSGDDAPDASPDDVFQILYTSGTTGDPKGVLLTHRNVISNVQAIAQLIPIAPEDRFLSILPLSHIFEQTISLLLPLHQGAHIVYAHSLAAITALMQRYQITKMAAVPEFLQVVMNRIEAKAAERGKAALFGRLLRVSGALGNQTVSRLIFRSVHKQFGGKLDTVASGGAPLDPLLERKWNALGVTVLQGYGLTETSPVLAMNTYRERRIGSVGKVAPGVDLKITADGEIVAKGPNVFAGYFKNEAKTREAFTADGWFKTDDAGWLDADGFLYVKGRKKYMILGPGGQNVFPEDIEAELNHEPEVKDSCVLGVEREGRVHIHAVLLGKDGIEDPEAVVARVNERLEPYQRIVAWSLWQQEDFPRSATRKVKKGEVMAYLESAPPAMQPPAKGASSPFIKLLADVSGQGASGITDETLVVRDLHLDSLLRVELVARIEEQFGVAVAESKITPATTVMQLQTLIDEAQPVSDVWQYKRWLIHPFMVGLRWLVQRLILPLSSSFMALRVEGVENLADLTGPVVFMPNHNSTLDSLAVLKALPDPKRGHLAFAAAADVFFAQYPWLVWFIELLLHIFPFPRQEGENVRYGLDYLGRLLDDGWSIVVYPEGQMSETGKLLPLKRGAGLIATAMDVPVVPVKIIGAEQVVPIGKVVPRRRGEVTVRFGKPMHFRRSDSYIEATTDIEKAMREL